MLWYLTKIVTVMENGSRCDRNLKIDLGIQAGAEVTSFYFFFVILGAASFSECEGLRESG